MGLHKENSLDLQALAAMDFPASQEGSRQTGSLPSSYWDEGMHSGSLLPELDRTVCFRTFSLIFLQWLGWEVFPSDSFRVNLSEVVLWQWLRLDSKVGEAFHLSVTPFLYLPPFLSFSAPPLFVSLLPCQFLRPLDCKLLAPTLEHC